MSVLRKCLFLDPSCNEQLNVERSTYRVLRLRVQLHLDPLFPLFLFPSTLSQAENLKQENGNEMINTA